jgi:hypothetical protein
VSISIVNKDPWMILALYSPMIFSMFQRPSTRPQFVINCRGCGFGVPAGTTSFPFESIMVSCCLCAERRRYRPSEVIHGKPHHSVLQRSRSGLR